MKSIYLFLISILLASCSLTSMTTNDLSKLDLHGKVKSLTFKERGNKDTLDILKKVITFNKKGNIITKDYFKTDATSIGKPSTKTIYSYTNFGEINVKKQYGSNGRIYRKENYVYNSKKKLIRKSRSDEKGNDLFIWNYKYNNNGEKVEVIINDVSYGGHTIDKSTFRYDAKSNLIERKNYDNNEVMQSVFTFKYKKNHLIALESIFHNKNTKTKTLNNYNKKGEKMESKSYDENNQLISTYITIYNSYNKKIKTINTKNGLEEVTIFKYQYDLHNNWITITEKEYFNDKLKTILKREIEYYTK